MLLVVKEVLVLKEYKVQLVLKVRSVVKEVLVLKEYKVQLALKVRSVVKEVLALKVLLVLKVRKE